jgi:ribosomal protein S27E
MKMHKNLSIEEDLITKAEEITEANKMKFNLSEFVETQLEHYILINSNTVQIECLSCGAKFSSTVWIKHPKERDKCFSCSGKLLKKTEYQKSDEVKT